MPTARLVLYMNKMYNLEHAVHEAKLFQHGACAMCVVRNITFMKQSCMNM